MIVRIMRKKHKTYKKQIGTERESSLHHSLKFRYAGEGGETEVSAASYVCDGINSEGELIEVQTGSFAPLAEKVRRLSSLGRIRIIHPIIMQKHIELYNTSGILLYRRKSPRKGSLWDLFAALIYAPELPLLPQVIVELAPVDVDETRFQDGCGSWRRKGVSITDRILSASYDSVCLESPRDYLRFIPFSKGETFSVKDLAKSARIRAALARKTLYVLTKMELVRRIGKKGNAWLYKIGE
jgi:hypothetical protein